MPEIISAKCFGCGHVVKVPSALGGKKARCPKCTNTITIPSPADSSGDFVSDEMLPEVARDEDVIEGEIVDEDGAPPSEPAVDAPRRPRSGSSWSRPAGTAARTREPKGGTRLRGAPPPRKGSSAGLVVGLLIAAAAVIAVVVAVAASGSKPPPPKPKPAPDSVDEPTHERNPAAESELEGRCREYFRAVYTGSHGRTLEFYIFEPNEKTTVAKGVTGILEQGSSYKTAEIKAVRVSGETATTTFVTDKEVTLNWRKVDGVWKIADKP
jgi:hypothetical protein